MASGKKPNFEKSLAELESIVSAMEEGDLSLEDALKSFEKGIKLTRDCQQALQVAEQKVSILSQGESGPEEIPFDQES